jgi:hypothetical protein
MSNIHDGSDQPIGHQTDDGELEVVDSPEGRHYRETALGQHMRWLRQAPDLYEKYQAVCDELAKAKQAGDAETLRTCAVCAATWKGIGDVPKTCPVCRATGQSTVSEGSQAGPRVDGRPPSDVGRAGDADGSAVPDGRPRVRTDRRADAEIDSYCPICSHALDTCSRCGTQTPAIPLEAAPPVLRRPAEGEDGRGAMNMADTTDDICPECGALLEYDEVDIGVGTIRRNFSCPVCGWMPPQGPEIADADEKQ